MKFHTRLAGLVMFAGLLMAMSSESHAAFASGKCSKLYHGVYARGGLHKAFATLGGMRPGFHAACGYSINYRLKRQAVSKAMWQCKRHLKPWERARSCRIIEAK